MLDVATHMQQLLQQAQTGDERPVDASFLPLALTMACLLRQLPPGLAPPSGGLSFHQLDRLPDHTLQHKLDKLLTGGGGRGRDCSVGQVKALGFVSSVVQYVKLSRALLAVCHEHLTGRTSALEAAQTIVRVVVDALSEANDVEQEAQEEEETEDAPSSSEDGERRTAEADKVAAQSGRRGASKSRRKVKMTSASAPPPPPPTVCALNASEVMKRAVSRDAGDGSAVADMMRKYPADECVQAKGVRALRLVLHKLLNGATAAQGSEAVAAAGSSSRSRAFRRQRRRQRRRPSGRSLSRDDDDDGASDSSSSNGTRSDDVDGTVRAHKAALTLVVRSMQAHPDNLPLQRDALLCVAASTAQGDARVVGAVASSEGLACVLNAMARLPDDQAASVGALSVLAHPQIAGS